MKPPSDPDCWWLVASPKRGGWGSTSHCLAKGKHDGWVWNLFPIVDGVCVYPGPYRRESKGSTQIHSILLALQLAAQMKSSHMMGRFESKPWKIVNSESVDLA